MDNAGFEKDVIKRRAPHLPIQRSISMHPNLLSRVSNDSLIANFKRKIFKTSSIRWMAGDTTTVDMKTQDDYEYVLEDKPLPDENASDSQIKNEGMSIEIVVQVRSDMIKQTLLEQARQTQIKISLFDDIASGQFDEDAASATFNSSSDLEKNLCFLWAALHKKWELFEPLLKLGADSSFQDVDGISAIHISSFVGCLMGTNFLITNGVDFNAIGKGFSPLHYAVFGNQTDVVKLLIQNGAIINLAKCEETPLHCAVRANSLECLKILLEEKVDINSIEPCGFNVVHLAAELGMLTCLEVLLDAKNVNINAKTSTKFKKMTALHLACEESRTEIVNLLLSKGANVRLTNSRGSTPLHLAAKSSSFECVEALLKMGRADPNAEDSDKRTPLHAAICKSDSAFDIIEMLIKQGATIDIEDQYGFTPLYLAAIDGVSDCVELLIFHGADVTAKSKKGNSALNVILRKTPSSLDMVTQKLNSAITLHNVHDSTNKGDVELNLDFRQLSRSCHPFEMKYLNSFVEDGKKEILLHPLCSAFLYLKWEKIRKYFVARFLFYLVFVSILTYYVYLTLINFPITKDQQGLHGNTSYIRKILTVHDHKTIYIHWWVLFVFALIEISYKCYGLFGYNSAFRYISHPENIIEVMVILSVFLISHLYFDTYKTESWQIHVGALAILAGWSNLMLMIGQLPVLGSYVAMYQKVQKEFAKLFLAYSCILIGFSFSFAVIFSNKGVFSDPLISFITTTTLVIGELSVDEFFDDSVLGGPFFLKFSSQLIYVLFIFFVTVVLMNLLVGIAVHDIQGLRNTAELSKLVRQTKLMTKIESALVKAYLPKRIMRILYASALLSPDAYRVAISVKPLNPGEKRLPQDIMMTAFDIAKMLKPPKRSMSAKMSMYLKRVENVSSEYVYDFDHGTNRTTVETDNYVLDEITKLQQLIKKQHEMLKYTLAKLDTFGDRNSSNC